jgi:hypothetical protein
MANRSDWEQIEPLGEGGQSQVFLVRRPNRGQERAASIRQGGYLLDSGDPYRLWPAPWVSAKHFTRDLYGAGPTSTACCARR